MAKGKDVRIRVILECNSCVRKGANEESMGVSRYSTQKNRHNTLRQLEFKFFCRYCRKHMTHHEIKKYEHPPCVRSFQEIERARTLYLIYKKTIV